MLIVAQCMSSGRVSVSENMTQAILPPRLRCALCFVIEVPFRSAYYSVQTFIEGARKLGKAD